MRTTFFTLILLLSMSCNKNNNESNTFQPLEITPILISKGIIFNSSYNPIQHNLVFNDFAEWNDFINNTWGISSIPPEANVNFDIHQVIATFDEPRLTGGYNIDIISIIEHQTNILVSVEYSGNGDLTLMPTRPYHFVKIPISNKPIIFE